MNLALRFLLELGVLVAAAIAGWQLFDGIARWAAVVAFPALLATMWGVFAVPDDPSRGEAAGRALGGGAGGNSISPDRSAPGVVKGPPVPVSGVVRLVVEAGFFGAGVAALWLIELQTVAIVFGVLVVFHYALSWDRVAWLIRSRR